jgi:hypothetical protein
MDNNGKSKAQLRADGFTAQHVIFGRFEQYFKKLPKYVVTESAENSKTDMEDKIDIIIRDNLKNVEVYLDVKSSKNADSITYTHVNGLGEKSKIYSGDFSIDLVFTLDTYVVGYIVKAKDFYKALMDKIADGKEEVSHYYEKSRFVRFSLDEIKNLAYATI